MIFFSFFPVLLLRSSSVISRNSISVTGTKPKLRENVEYIITYRGAYCGIWSITFRFLAEISTLGPYGNRIYGIDTMDKANDP